jgi:hypothetical protein
VAEGRKKCATDAWRWLQCGGQLDREELVRFGKILDKRPAVLGGRTVAMVLAERLLQVRTRKGAAGPLRANAVQWAFEQRRSRRNIVLKARQMGLTTWAAGRFFLKTITQPGRVGDVAYVERKLRALRRMLEEPNAVDSFRTLMEQAIEDALTGGFGAIEMEPTGDGERPAMLWPVDGASIRINARWNGQQDSPRYAQVQPGQLESNAVDLRDDQLMYIRLNPRSFTPFGLGPLEVAFETVNQFLSAHRFAGKLAANSVAQYALWLNEATPAQHDRLIRWWQDDIEGTGRVPLLSTPQKPEVLRFAQGTDADLRLAWQEFLIRMVANAFGLPPLMLGLEADVNQSTAAEMTDEAFRGAISPLAQLLAGHITRDLFGKCVGCLSLQSLSFTASVKRALANDVTVCGEHEPVAYVTEYFPGDGVTTQFYLAADPFFPAASKSKLISELFNEPAINTTVWSSTGAGGYIALGAGGLTITGGNGVDGQTSLSWIDPVEMGGTLLLEAVGVSLSLGSTGALAGFYVGLETQPSCVAGFAVAAQSGTGAVSVQPLIQGFATGTSYPINPANQYSLRVRVHCVEVERTLSLYRSFGDSGPITYGGQTTSSAGRLQLEIQEFVDGAAGLPVTLYDGGVASLPPACTVVPASSISLVGTMRAIHLTNLGTGWVVSTPPSGGPYTRRIGTLAEAAECHVERTGKAVFYAGSIPVTGEQIAVSYRTIGRGVGRAVNAASQQALTAAGSPAVAAWIGSVTSPAARSSADCLNAATAIEQAAAGVSALWSGSYLGNRFSFSADVWPGDALQLNAPSSNLNAQVVVRAVKVSYCASYPDFVQYSIQFANDWADDLAIKTSATVPADAWLPATVAPAYLANLTNLSVTALSGSTVSINTGVTPPSGGGFEVRRRDFAFMPGEDPGLVVRATLPNITFSRETASDRFYIRMYDDATPPNYSEFSTALFINLPLAS